MKILKFIAVLLVLSLSTNSILAQEKNKEASEDKKEEKDMFYLKFETYNNKLEGKFERSDIRHIIEILDNAI